MGCSHSLLLTLVRLQIEIFPSHMTKTIYFLRIWKYIHPPSAKMEICGGTSESKFSTKTHQIIPHIISRLFKNDNSTACYVASTYVVSYRNGGLPKLASCLVLIFTLTILSGFVDEPNLFILFYLCSIGLVK